MRKFKLMIVGLLLLAVLPVHAGLQVFACEPEWAALSSAIGGDKVSVYSATTAYQDVHRIQARPSLIAKVRKAGLVICSGAELEAAWLPLLLRRAANPKVQPGKPGYLMAAMQVERLDVHQAVDRSMGDVHGAGNPHVHLDPKRMMIIAEALAQRLVEIDSSNTEYYQQQLQQFLQQWRDAIHKWEQQAAPLKGVEVVVHHKDWRYLLDWLGMKEVATLEPKPGLPPKAGHLSKLKQQMAEQPASMILYANYQNKRPAVWLAEQTAIATVELPYTVGGSEAATDLIPLYDEIISRLLAALE